MAFLNTTDTVLCIKHHVLNTADDVLCIKDDDLNTADDVLCIKGHVLNTTDDAICIKDDDLNTTDDVLCIKDDVLNTADEVLCIEKPVLDTKKRCREPKTWSKCPIYSNCQTQAAADFALHRPRQVADDEAAAGAPERFAFRQRANGAPAFGHDAAARTRKSF